MTFTNFTKQKLEEYKISMRSLCERKTDYCHRLKAVQVNHFCQEDVVHLVF